MNHEDISSLNFFKRFGLNSTKTTSKSLAFPLTEYNLYINDKFVEAKMFEMHVELNMPKMSRHFALYG
jgi:hypothetical protein